MKNKMIVAALTSYKDRFWENKDFGVDEKEVIRTLQEVKLQTLTLRKEAIWDFVIELYKQLPKVKSAEQLKVTMFNVLCDKPYINEVVIEGLLRERYLHKENNIETFHKLYSNSFTEAEEKKNRGDIIHFLVELTAYYTATKANGSWTRETINNCLDQIITTKFKAIQDYKGIRNNAQDRRRVKRDGNLREFAMKYSSSHEVFANCLSNLLGAQIEVKQDILVSQKEPSLVSEEFSFEDGLANMLSEMGLGEEVLPEVPKTETTYEALETPQMEAQALETVQVATSEMPELVKNQVEAEVTPEAAHKVASPEVEVHGAAATTDVETQVEAKKSEDMTQKALLRHLNEMAGLLGYELHQKGDQVMSKEAYEIQLAETENAKVKIFKELAQLKNQAVLSELYNAYTHIKNVSYDNLEAILGNFFNMLAMQGVEVEEEGLEVGESIKVETTQALKDFIFEQPTRQQGQVEAKVLYKAWAYKGKTIMPKVVKVKEEA